jgi:uncharacterized protein (DUF2147 family)
MKKITTRLFILFSLFLMHSILSAAPFMPAQTPVGYWKTIDDVTGKPKSILKIEQAENGSLFGRVVKIFPRPGYDQNEICTACQGERHNKPIVGMEVMSGLKQNPDDTSEWQGGEILDPSNGKTYRCFVQVMDNGQKLRVRGYIGVALFGRSQTWLRVGGSEG